MKYHQLPVITVYRQLHSRHNLNGCICDYLNYYSWSATDMYCYIFTFAQQYLLVMTEQSLVVLKARLTSLVFIFQPSLPSQLNFFWRSLVIVVLIMNFTAILTSVTPSILSLRFWGEKKRLIQILYFLQKEKVQLTIMKKYCTWEHEGNDWELKL